MGTDRCLTDTTANRFTVQAFAGGRIAVLAHCPKIAIRDWRGECI